MSPRLCAKFRGRLSAALKNCEIQEEDVEFATRLLDACSLVLRPPERHPLIPVFEGASSRPEDFSDDDLELFQRHAGDLCAELRARVNDIHWLARRDAARARQAIQDYAESARDLAADVQGAREAKSRFRRALGIAARMKNHEAAKDVARLATEIALDDSLSQTARVGVTQFLIEVEEGDPKQLAACIRTVAEQENVAAPQSDAYNWDWLRGVWKTLADAESWADNEDAARQALLSRVDTYVAQADWLEAKDAKATMVQGLLRNGIQALRNVSGDNSDRRDAMHRRLRALQPTVLASMKRIELGSIDLTEDVRNAVRQVTGHGFREALFRFVMLVELADPVEVRGFAEESAKQSAFRMFIPQAIFDSEGRLVRTVPGVSFDDPSSVDAAHRAEMLRHLSMRRDCHAKVLDQARQQIALEHPATVQQWVGAIGDSPFVSGDRARSWIRGLDAGLRGDFITACYVLTPQLEHGLRSLLFAVAKTLPEWVDENGVQQYRLLSALLEDEQLKAILGERLHFELDALLGRDGQNFRNLIAHGLFSDGALNTPDALYLWYLALRLVLWPALVTEAGERQADGGESDDPPSDEDTAAAEDDPGPDE
ncbi:MAG: DUF4209 domain-containing protein [Sandaracinaceae bacterium]